MYRLKGVQGIPVLHFDNLIMGRAISQDGKTIYTMDTYNREDWKEIKPDIPLQNVSQFLLRMDGFGWVLQNGNVMVTNDGGKTWNVPAAAITKRLVYISPRPACDSGANERIAGQTSGSKR
ncbi:hypothetical protein LJK88_23640 [Paenibacillus sp. P26]|nr:hypothetical protein LJK88_23640 [Paenibacillus sp. P26]